MKMKTIMALAAVAALAVPASASAASAVQQQGTLMDVSGTAEGATVLLPLANLGDRGLLFNFGQFVESRIRVLVPENGTSADKLEWRSQDTPAPDGTDLRTDIYRQETVQSVLGDNGTVVLNALGFPFILFNGTILDDNGASKLATVQAGKAELTAETQKGDDLSAYDPANCNWVVPVDDATGLAVMAGSPDEQPACP